MTQTQHTQGPWLIANNGSEGKETSTFRIWRNDPNQPQGDDFINRGYACIAPHVHGKANANLIAAAPELLEALENAAVSIHDAREALFEAPEFPERKKVAQDLGQRLEELQVIIAKARGQS